jgi:hypothetical protein
LLDFNELQRGHGNATDAGTGGSGHPDATAGSGGTGGTGTGGTGTGATGGTGTGGSTAGSGGKSDGGSAIHDGGVGTDGGDASSCDCDDGDPCTTDRCTKAGACVHDPLGAIPDGFSDSVSSTTLYRTTMTVLDNRFYVSALETVGTKYELAFHDFGLTEKALGLGTTLTALMPGAGTGMPTAVSAAGFEKEQSNGTIVAYVAMGTAPVQGQVYRFEFEPGLLGTGLRYQSGAPAAVDTNYVGTNRLFPIAWNLGGGGGDYAAWPGSGGIYLQNGNNALKTGTAPTFGVGAGPFSGGLGPLGVGSSPGVSFVNSSGLHAQGLGQPIPSDIPQCDARAGTFIADTSVPTGIDGVSFAASTRTFPNNGGILTEETPLLCKVLAAYTSCGGDSSCTKDSEVLSATRAPAITFFTRANDPVGRVYEVQALPYNDPTQSLAYLALQVVRIDIDLNDADAAAKTTLITPTPVVVATAPLSTGGTTGPQWPAVAFAGTDRVGLSWLEPGIATAGTTGTTHDELHVARYRICFPP